MKSILLIMNLLFQTPQSSRRNKATRVVTPEEIFPFPKAGPRQEKTKGRRKGKTMIATDSPERNEIEFRKSNKIIKRSKTTTKKSKTTAKKSKTVTKQLFKASEEDSVVVDVGESCEGLGECEESDGDREEIPVPRPNDKPNLSSNPTEGDYVLVKFIAQTSNRGKAKAKPIFYVGKVIKEVDSEGGDCEVSYLRINSLRKFVMPQIPDLKSVSLRDILMILPKPKVGDTKRQQCQYTFDVDFSLITLG